MRTDRADGVGSQWRGSPAELHKLNNDHLTLALHYLDALGRNRIQTVLFNENVMMDFETACLDRRI